MEPIETLTGHYLNMKFSFDQFSEQIKTIDKELESNWKDLKDLCEGLLGKEFDGTLQAVDGLFASQMLENSVCVVNNEETIGNICKELVNFVEQNPGSEKEAFDALLKIQFREGLNFPIWLKGSKDAATRAGSGGASGGGGSGGGGDKTSPVIMKPYFDDENFNELFTILQRFFINELMIESNIDVNSTTSTNTATTTTTTTMQTCVVPPDLQFLVCFSEETNTEYKSECFQSLSLLSSCDHAMVLYANSKLLSVQSKLSDFKSNTKVEPTDFIKAGQKVLNLLDKDVDFLRLCLDETDVIGFISTVYSDSFLDALNTFVTNLVKRDGSCKTTGQSEAKKSSRDLNSAKDSTRLDEVALQRETILKLLNLIGWLTEVDKMLMRMQNSSLRCVVGQERIKSVGRSERFTEMKSSLKTSSATPKTPQANRTARTCPPSDILSWPSTFTKFSFTFLQHFTDALQQCNKDNSNIVSTFIPPSLQHDSFSHPVAYKASIELAENLRNLRHVMKMFMKTDGELLSKSRKMFSDVVDKHLKLINKKVNKDTTIENMMILVSGVDFLKHFLNQSIENLEGDNLFDEKLEGTKDQLVHLICLKFMDVITISVWHDDENEDEDGDEPSFAIENWRLQMAWLSSQLSMKCSFETCQRVLIICHQETLQNFTWFYVTKELKCEKDQKKFVSDVRSILIGSLEMLVNCCGRTEELINAYPNDGKTHKVHVLCLALTSALFVVGSPLSVLKKLYEKATSRQSRGIQSDDEAGSDSQWLRLVKPNWNLIGKTKVQQLELKTSHELLLSMVENHSLQKQHLILQLMMLHEGHFTVTILHHLLVHEPDRKNEEGDDDDGGGGDDDDDEFTLIVNSFLRVVMKCQVHCEQVFDHIIMEVANKMGSLDIFREGSAILRFFSKQMEPAILRIMWKSIKDHEKTSSSSSSSSPLSRVSFFSQERLFCGCKSSGVVKQSDEGTSKERVLMNIFMSNLLKDFHFLPFLTSRLCFKYDGRSKTDYKPIIVKVLQRALTSVMEKVTKYKIIEVNRLKKLNLIEKEFNRLVSSESKDCEYYEDFMKKLDLLGKEILKDRKDENDPGLNIVGNLSSTFLLQVLLQSIHSNKSDKQSLDIITHFLGNNLQQLKEVFNIVEKTPQQDSDNSRKNAGNVPGNINNVEKLVDISFNFCLSDDLKSHSKSPPKPEGNNKNGFNPLKVFERMKFERSSNAPIEWERCLKMDLGLTEVNFPNLIKNRPEFASESTGNLDESSKSFVDDLKRNHLKDLI